MRFPYLWYDWCRCKVGTYLQLNSRSFIPTSGGRRCDGPEPTAVGSPDERRLPPVGGRRRNLRCRQLAPGWIRERRVRRSGEVYHPRWSEALSRGLTAVTRWSWNASGGGVRVDAWGLGATVSLPDQTGFSPKGLPTLGSRRGRREAGTGEHHGRETIGTKRKVSDFRPTWVGANLAGVGRLFP